MQNANITSLAAVTENLKKVEANFEGLLHAAEGGDAEAQYRLGGLYRGQYAANYVVSQEAIRWYERAAEQGHAWAQFVLGYESTDEDLDRDLLPLRNEPEEARKWIRLAAEQGVSEAISCMIKMYRYGLVGMEKNPDEAARWALRDDDFTPDLLDMLKHGECRIPTTDELNLVARVRAKAESGADWAQRAIGDLLAVGLPTLPANEEEAVRWHGLSAEHINEGGYFPPLEAKTVSVFRRHLDRCNARLLRFVGQMYQDGHGVEATETEAAFWYEIAAEKGDAQAQWLTAQGYDLGKGVQQNPEAAAKWYRKAADQEVAAAQNNLAVMYEQGRGVSQNYRLARHWFKRAAVQGDETAQFKLGQFYRLGLGVKANNKTATTWYRKASRKGYTHGSVALAVMTGEIRDLVYAVEALFSDHLLVDFRVMEGWTESFDDFKSRLEALVNSSWISQDEESWVEVSDADEQHHWVKKLPVCARVAATLRGMLAAVSCEQGMDEAKLWFEMALRNGDIVAAFYLAYTAYRCNPSDIGYNQALEYLAPESRLAGFVQRLARLKEPANTDRSIPADSMYGNEFNVRMKDLMLTLRQSVLIEQEREKTRKQQLSFLSHTLSNASAGAQDTIRRAARLLGTVQADKPETLRRAMERLSGQIASLALIETLVASFKLYASDPDRVRESWDNEQAGEIAFVRVLALALRQVLTRLFTLPGHALDLRRLLPENGEALAQEFVAEIMVLDLESDAEAARLIAWVQDKLPFLELLIEDDASMRFAQGGARFVVTFAVLAEILTNSVKYASASPISMACGLAQRQMRIVCLNHVQARPPQALDSGGTGITFLREICRIVGADIHDSLDESGQFEVVFTAKA